MHRRKNTKQGIGAVGLFRNKDQEVTTIGSVTGKYRAINKSKKNELIKSVMSECIRQASIALEEGRIEDSINWLSRASEANRKRMTDRERDRADA